MSALQTVRDTAFVGCRWLELAWARPLERRPRAGRHLALFAWALPPNSNAGVHRPLSFIRHGSALGWRIDAFHGEVPHNQSQHGHELLARVPAAARLHLVPPSSRQPSWRWSPQIDGGFKNALENARHAIDRLADDPPDVVLASGPPFHVFVAARFVAHHFGVPLVLDYRDEWSECPFDFVGSGPDDRAWEQRCLASADAVLFTTHSHLEHQLARFPQLDRRRAFLIPNGWEPDDFATRDSGAPKHYIDPARLRVAHVGNLAGHAPPGPFLQTLDGLLARDAGWRARLQVEFVGRRSPEADAALQRFGHPANIVLTDHVSKHEANRRMEQADVLLLIATPDLQRYLPGKLFDYVAAGRPVLIVGSPGEASAVLERLGIGQLCSPGEPARLAECLDRLAALRLQDSGPVVAAWLAEHRRDVLAQRGFELLAALVDGNGTPTAKTP